MGNFFKVFFKIQHFSGNSGLIGIIEQNKETNILVLFLVEKAF